MLVIIENKLAPRLRCKTCALLFARRCPVGALGLSMDIICLLDAKEKATEDPAGND